MKKHRIHRLWVPILLAGLTATGSVMATTLNDIYAVSDRINAQAKRSQARIDALTEETRKLLGEYKTVLKEIEGLRVYNRQLQKQISNQETEMTKLASSIDQVTLIERQITPLMLRMIDGLEQSIALDVPFLLEERNGRIAQLKEIMERSDVSVAEKFRKVMEAYQIEMDFGSTAEWYSHAIDLGGDLGVREYSMLRIGRIGLYFQSDDASITGMWDPESKEFVVLDNEHRNEVRKGLRMARQLIAPELLLLPVPAAQAAGEAS